MALLSQAERDNRIRSIIEVKKNSEGANRKWTEDEVTLRRECVYYWLGRGKSRTQLKVFLAELWDCTPRSVYTYIKDAEDALTAEARDNIEEYRKKMIEKLQRIADDAMAAGDRKSALLAYEQINKLEGAYTQKVEADIKGDVHFDFGE